MQFCEISYDEEISFGLARFPQCSGDVEGMNEGIEDEFGKQSDPNAICQMLMKMHFSNRCAKRPRHAVFDTACMLLKCHMAEEHDYMA